MLTDLHLSATNSFTRFRTKMVLLSLELERVRGSPIRA